MDAPTVGVKQSEELILRFLEQHEGRMAIVELFEALKKAGLHDETLIKAAIWHLIAQDRIDRDADAILVHQQ